MKKRTWYLLGAAALVLAGVILFFALSAPEPEGTYDNLIANGGFDQIDEDGVPVEDSFIEIEGVYHHNFWNDESFRGDFRVEAFPETLREDVSAVIFWQSFTWEDENGKKQKRVDPFILLYRYSFLTDIADGNDLSILLVFPSSNMSTAYSADT